MSDRFRGIPRGPALPGAKEIAGYIWGDTERWRSAYLLPRSEFGIMELSGRLTGFAGWIDAALAAKAEAGKKRRRPRKAAAVQPVEAA